MDYSRLKKAIKDKRYSIREVSEKIGMSEVGFHQSIKNNTLKIETLEKIANVLEMPISYFFEPKDEEVEDFFKDFNLPTNPDSPVGIMESLIMKLEEYIIDKHKEKQDKLTYNEFNKIVYSELFEIKNIRSLLEKNVVHNDKLRFMCEKYKPKE
jgi:transcriptional regulator with XRE-family HTH domain